MVNSDNSSSWPSALLLIVRLDIYSFFFFLLAIQTIFSFTFNWTNIDLFYFLSSLLFYFITDVKIGPISFNFTYFYFVYQILRLTGRVKFFLSFFTFDKNSWNKMERKNHNINPVREVYVYYSNLKKVNV